jgi:hypothetical protein
MIKRQTKKIGSQIEYDPDEFLSAEESLESEVDALFYLDEHMERHFHDAKYRAWFRMCIEVDQSGDFAPMLDLIQSAPLPKEMRPFIRDLFERHGLIKGVRKDLRRTPLYKLTPSEVRLKAACEEVEMYVRGYGTNFDVAIQQSAEYWKIDVTTLENAYMGRHNPTRKMKARIKKRHIQI